MTRIGESGHQRLYASERLAFYGRTVHLGTEHLISTHAVTDEIEHVLSLGACGDRYDEQ